MEATLRGNLSFLPQTENKSVRIFLSSTFTDMIEERNSLMRNVFPKLKTFCQEHGLEFEVVDMRWGVTDHASADHMTTKLCMRELAGCQRLSIGPSFVAFLGDKYGYRPFPPIISKDEFLAIRDGIVATCSDEDLKIVDEWFQIDTNSVPEEYVLQTITVKLPHFGDPDPQYSKLKQKDSAIWWNVFERLQSTLRKGSYWAEEKRCISKTQLHRYRMSVTEDEVRHGIMDSESPSKTSICFLRTFNGLKDNINSKFIDAPNNKLDSEAQDLLQELKETHLPAVLDSKNMESYSLLWSDRETSSQRHSEYIKNFCNDFSSVMKSLILEALNKRDGSQIRSQTMKDLFNEVLHHSLFCNTKCRNFHGRKELLGEIEEKLKNGVKPLVITGGSGCGKTSVMAKVIQSGQKWFGKSCYTVFRFLGTSPSCSAVHQMLQSVCSQIYYIYKGEFPSLEILEDYNQLVQFFQVIVNNLPSSDKPLFIVLDSIDQLSSANNAHKLYWLPRNIPENVYFVISMLPHILEDAFLDRNIEIKPMSNDAMAGIMSAWLQSAGRTLNQQQAELVNQACSKCPHPLFLKLLFNEASTWRSYLPIDLCRVSYTVKEAIIYIFQNIEKKHGQILVSHSFGLISASEHGLSETELEDSLSADDAVLNEVYIWWDPPVDGIIRIPSLLWKRIRYEVDEFLVERQAGGKTVLAWYHRQFSETSRDRYLNGEDMVDRNKTIAGIFLGEFEGLTSITLSNRNKTFENVDRQITLQPLKFGKRYNVRKLEVLPYQLAMSEQFEILKKDVLCNFDWILAKLTVFTFLDLLCDYELYLSLKEDEDVKLVHQTLLLGSRSLKTNPIRLAGQIIGRLDIIAKTHKDYIQPLVDRARDWASKTDKTVIVPRRGYFIPPGGPLVTGLAGHSARVDSIRLSEDRQYLVSVGSHEGNTCLLNVWMYEKQDLISTVTSRGSARPVLALAPDGRHVFFGCDKLGVYLLHNGSLVEYLDADNTQPFTAVAVSSIKPMLASATKCGSIFIWSLPNNDRIFKYKADLTITQVDFILNSSHVLLTFSKQNTVRKINIESMEETSLSLKDKVSATASPPGQGEIVVIGTEKGNIVFVDLVSFEVKSEVNSHSSKPVTCGLISSDGRLAITGGKDKVVCVHDLHSMQCTSKLKGHKDAIWCLDLHENTLVTGAKDDNLMVWNLDDNQCLNILEGHSSWISDVIVTKEGHEVISSCNDKTIRIWDAQQKPIPKEDWQQCNVANCLALSEDGMFAISCTPDGTRIYDTGTGNMLEHSKTCFTSLKLLMRQTFIGGTSDGSVYEFVIQNNKLKLQKLFKGHEESVNCVVIASYNHDMIATGSADKTVRIWDTTVDTSISLLQGHEAEIMCLAATIDFHSIVSGSDDKTAKLWTADGECLHTLTGHSKRISCVAVSYYVITGSDDFTCRIWEPLHGSCVNIIQGYTEEIKCLEIYEDGCKMVVGSHEAIQQLKAWDVVKNSGQSTTRPLLTFEGHGHAVLCCKVIDNLLITGSRDCTIKAWNVNTGINLGTINCQSQIKHLDAVKQSDGNYIIIISHKGGCGIAICVLYTKELDRPHSTSSDWRFQRQFQSTRATECCNLS